MTYKTVSEIAKSWKISERSVRDYCAKGKIDGAILEGKTWKIPFDAKKPLRKKREAKKAGDLLSRLKLEKEADIKGGIYHKVQIELTYNSNHIEGSRLSHDQTRFIYETNTIGLSNGAISVDDIVETVNHFRCIDFVIEMANYPLSETFIKQLHFLLKTGTGDSRKDYFATGEYKRFPNEVGGKETCKPEDVSKEMKKLLKEYNSSKKKTLKEIINFHYCFETIHPFQDGNGRVGRLIVFKECLRNDIVPFIISDDLKLFYYRGLKEWEREEGYLMDTCLTAQDRFKAYLNYFEVEYKD
ncbi:MAG: Fic family protein [Erysipelotrichaceae bacterium]|nr:Fic family protein [Erysipelotrichaceae bacterium]